MPVLGSKHKVRHEIAVNQEQVDVQHDGQDSGRSPHTAVCDMNQERRHDEISTGRSQDCEDV